MKLTLKTQEYILNCDNRNIVQISQDAGMIYSYASTMTKLLRKEGIISVKKLGRQKIISLTPKGKRICYCLNEIFTLIK